MNNQYYCTKSGKLVNAANKRDVATMFHCKTTDVMSLEEFCTYVYENMELQKCKGKIEKSNVETADRNEFGSSVVTISVSPSNYAKICQASVGEEIHVICNDEDEVVLKMNGKIATPKVVNDEIVVDIDCDFVEKMPPQKPDRHAAKQKNKQRGNKNNKNSRNSGRKSPRVSSSSQDRKFREEAIRDGLIVPADSQGSEAEHKGWIPARSKVRSYE